MVKSYLKVAFRNSKKNPVYTFINIAGLAAGIACCIIIALYVLDELSYDSYHENADRIYRVSQATIIDDTEERTATTPLPLKDAILRDFPAYAEKGARFFDFDTEKVSIANPENREIIRHDRFFFTDPDALEMFDIRIVRGDPTGALGEPNSVILTERVAQLYFGDEDPIGKDLIFEGRVRLNVSAIMEEWPRNSHFKADVLASFETLRGLWGIYDEMITRWRWNPLWTYIMLTEGADASVLETQLKDYNERYYADFFSERETIDLELQPLTDVWLRSGLDGEIEPVSSHVNIYLFSVIALLILVIACINFINLSTAGAMYRSKEVGLRKVMGAERSGLVFQFLLEAIIYTIAALLLALLIVALVLPWFSAYMDRTIDPGVIGTGSVIGLLFLLVISIAGLSGFYPTAILSSFNPIESLRGRLSLGKSGVRMRKGLVVFQFSITAFLLIATSIAWMQYQLLQQQDMGFDREHVLVVPVAMTSAIWEYDTFRERALEHSAILSVSGSQILLGGTEYWKYDVTPEGVAESESRSFTKMFVMHDFLETMDIPLAAGRDFSRDFSTDPEQALLINREMVNYLNWGSPEEAVGRTFRVHENLMTVVGVTENFNHNNLRRELEPLIMELPAHVGQLINNVDYMKIRLASGHPGDAIEYLEGIWSDVDRTHMFDWFFLDDRLNQIYRSEQLLTSVLSAFAIIAVIIGCLGLLGLTAYSVNRRRREIAIRKTLGLSATGVFTLLSKDYLKLILYAHLIALPLVYIAASRWLEMFAYRIDLGYYIAITFALSLLISAAISLLTISSQSVKAALMNPATNLRSE